ncbi:MAG: fibronectin type III domain-containing protein [Solirubrobacteraceae bacterium]
MRSFRSPARAGALLAAAALSCTLVAALPVATAQAETVTLPGDAATGLETNSQIYQVACPAAGDCVGVGYYNDLSANHQALIESENGGVWTPSEVPASSLPSSDGSSPQPELTSVACPVAFNCVATDAFDESTSDEQGLIDSETSGSWTPSVAPLTGLSLFSNPGVEVTPVACPAVDACVGVGNYGDKNDSLEGLIETQSAAGWSASEALWPSDTDAASFAPDFYDLSCATAGSCAAVGFYTDSNGDQQGLLESDSGGSWSATELDLSNLGPGAGEPPAANPQASGYAVSCPAAGDCTAVGNYEDDADSYVPLAVSEVDGQWQAAVALGLPGDASTTADGARDPIQNDLFVNGVSCASAGNCTAVGSYDATSDNNVDAFALTETGGSWGAATKIGFPSGADAPAENPEAALDSVTCQSAGDCFAAGTYAAATGENVALVARESAGSWSTAGADLTTSYDADESNMYWASVACAPGSYCAAGGFAADDQSGNEDAFMLSAPAAPLSPTASFSGTRAAVAWAAPSDTGGLPISGYTITANDLTNPAAGGQTASAAPAATTATITGLTPTDTYTFTVAAGSLLGTGLPATSAPLSQPPSTTTPTTTTPTTTTPTTTTPPTTTPTTTTPPTTTPTPTITATAPTPTVSPATIIATPSRARLAASLAQLLRPHGAAASLSRLRRTHRDSLRYRALEPGRLSVRWYHGAVSRGRRRRELLVAAGTATIARAGTITLNVRLTRAGRRLVGNAGRRAIGHRAVQRLRLTVTVEFGSAGVSVRRSAGFTLG